MIAFMDPITAMDVLIIVVCTGGIWLLCAYAVLSQPDKEVE